MPRIRTIRPEFFLDTELSELPVAARLFFIGLWTQADREGRLEDNPKRLKAQIFPWDNVDSEKLLATLSPRFVTRYEAEGRRYVQVNTFTKHQRPHPREAASEIPAPTAKQVSREKVVPCREKDLTSKLDKGNGVMDTLDTGSRFRPPVFTEVQAYCQEKAIGIDPQRFIDHYEANGWRVGPNRMKDWRAAVRTWEGRRRDEAKTGAQPALTADAARANTAALLKLRREQDATAGVKQ